jgi:fructose/tagatose bisphosphate aldolase
MPLVPFPQLMADAAAGGYAVGYFESWNLESLLAVADAAEARRSPVILGFSGIYLPHPRRRVKDRLAPYAAMARAVGDALTVPACLLFNECPNEGWVSDAIDAGFNLVMFSDRSRSAEESVAIIRRLGADAHGRGAAIEAEAVPLAGVGGDLAADAADAGRLTDPVEARAFIEATGIDAFAVNIGQVHLHGRRTVRLDLDRLKRLASLSVPLVLHGASSVDPDDLRAAILLGIRKINVGSRLKQAYFNALRDAVGRTDTNNPYEIIGSGLDRDVLVAGRLAMQSEVERLMRLFGSAGKAEARTP